MAEQAYGGFWVRVLAYLVDSVVCFTLLVVLAAGAAFLGGIGATIVTAGSFLVPLAYWAVMQALARQATLGKALLGMKVTNTDGERISIARSVVRELAKYVSAIPMGIGFLLAAFTGRKQALHDMIASTTVPRESSGHVLVALLVGVFGWIAPIGLVMVVGAGLVAGMMGFGTGAMLGAMKEPSDAKVIPRTASAAKSVPAPAPQKPAAAPTPPEPAADVVAARASTPKPSAAPEPPKQAASPKPVSKPEQVREAAPAPVKIAAVAPDAKAADAPAPPIIQRMPAQPGPKYNDLMSAVMAADPAGVQELLAFGKWPDKPDTRGFTPLMVAAMRGDRDSAELLLKAGADPGRPLNWSRQGGDPAMTALLERYLRR